MARALLAWLPALLLAGAVLLLLLLRALLVLILLLTMFALLALLALALLVLLVGLVGLVRLLLHRWLLCMNTPADGERGKNAERIRGR